MYHDVYGAEEGDTTLELITAACGVRRSASVVPGRPVPGRGGGAGVLHAIGATKAEIDDAVKQVVKERDRVRDNEQNTADGEQASRQQDQAAKQQEGKANEQRLRIELEQAKANVRKTDAETADIKKPDSRRRRRRKQRSESGREGELGS